MVAALSLIYWCDSHRLTSRWRLSMKPTLLAALAVVAALIILDGCAEPTPVAKSTAEKENAGDAVARAPITSRNNDSSNLNASGSRNRSGDVNSKSDKTNTGRPVPTERNQPGTLTSQPNKGADAKGALKDRSSAGDVASKRPSPAKKRTSPKKEFKLEFVSATGKEGLSPGDTIPNIKGEDIDGIKFKLSDYSGKVIMIDFWGDW